jgi:hypothetical protein
MPQSLANVREARQKVFCLFPLSPCGTGVGGEGESINPGGVAVFEPQGLVYQKAGDRECAEIDKLRRRYILANVIHNPNRLESASAIAKAIKSRLRRTT